MKISTKGRYALRLMLDLAVYNTGEPISLKDVAILSFTFILALTDRKHS